MLHPDLGLSCDPFSVWQIDTDEIREVQGIYAAHLAGAEGTEQYGRVLGLLWKKLGGASRLASLVREYAKLRWNEERAASRDEIRLVGASFRGPGASNPAARTSAALSVR